MGLVGNSYVGQEPSVKNTSTGGRMCTFSIVTSETYRKNDERVVHDTWHSIVVFNENLINNLEKVLKKGMLVYVDGSLKSYKTEVDGQQRTITNVQMREFKVLSGELELE